MSPWPDCAWCDAAATLKEAYVEQGVTFCECSCCGKLTRVDCENNAHRVEPRPDVRDVNGVVMYGE